MNEKSTQSPPMESSRVLGFAELIERSIATYRKRCSTFIGILIPPAAITLLLNLLFGSSETSAIESSSPATAALLIGSSIMVVLTVAALQLAGALALLSAALDPSINHVRQAYKKGWNSVVPYLGIVFRIILIIGALVGITSALLFAIPVPIINAIVVAVAVFVGLYISIPLLLSPFIVLAGKKRGTAVIRESFRIVQHHWWSIFWRFFLLIILSAFIAFLLGLFISTLPFIIGVVVGSIFNVLWAPFVVIYIALLYTNLIRQQSKFPKQK